jgi:hypothetical protein
LLARRPVWALPIVVLASLSLLAAFALHAATGGREIAEDAPFLLGLARRPFVLFRSYVEARTGSNWGSFPPLLPLLFGVPIRPWTGLVSDFWTIRFGVLAWTALALLALERVLVRLEHVEPARAREALLVFALLPSTWGPAAVLPQEESYVSLFALALYAAARAGRFRIVPALLVLTAFSAKYFLLVLAVPLAFATPRPWRRLVAWGALAGGALAAYVGYHALRFDLLPIVSHRVAPTMSISLWGLLWHLGVQPSLPIVSLTGVAGAGSPRSRSPPALARMRSRCRTRRPARSTSRCSRSRSPRLPTCSGSCRSRWSASRASSRRAPGSRSRG